MFSVLAAIHVIVVFPFFVLCIIFTNADCHEQYDVTNQEERERERDVVLIWLQLLRTN